MRRIQKSQSDHDGTRAVNFTRPSQLSITKKPPCTASTYDYKINLLRYIKLLVTQMFIDRSDAIIVCKIHYKILISKVTLNRGVRITSQSLCNDYLL